MLRVVMADRERRPAPPYLATRRAVAFGSGFHDEERDEAGTFRWMGSRGELELPEDGGGAGRFLELLVLSEFFDLAQELAVAMDGEGVCLPLPRGWSRISLAVPAAARSAALRVDRLFPAALHPGDPRELAVRLRDPAVHADPERHRHVAAQHRNAVLNRAEMLAGRAVLESKPPLLGIDLHGVCNVKPPCVYCEWDASKAAEGENVDVPFTVATAASYGPFFDQAAALINCSIGEPFLMKDIDELLDLFGDRGKLLSISSNGQVLTDRNIERLLGRDIELYVSLDAATPATYARLRNEHFERILANLRRLIRAKGGRHRLPRVYLVFMPMKANLAELPAFVRLCAGLEADALVLRPLNPGADVPPVWERGGYRFVYGEELLPFDEIVRASGRAAALARRLGVRLHDQLDFGVATGRLFADLWAEGFRSAEAVDLDEGWPAADRSVAADASPAHGQARASGGSSSPSVAEPVLAAAAPGPAAPPPSLGAERLPICREPWENFYILRRGVMPCCYGGRPLAPMDGFVDAWNSPELQEIRRSLAAGQLAPYCLASPACPIVRKTLAAAPPGLAPRHAALRAAWHRFDRAAGRLPGRLLAPLRRAARALRPAR